MAWRLVDRVGFDLHFIAPAQINAAVGLLSAIKLNVQLEVFVLRVVDQLRSVPRRNQLAIFDLPHFLRAWVAHVPACKVFLVEKVDWFSPFWRLRAHQHWRALACPLPRFAVRTIHSARQSLSIQRSLKNHVCLRALFLFRRNNSELPVCKLGFRQRTRVAPAPYELRYQMATFLL